MKLKVFLSIAIISIFSMATTAYGQGAISNKIQIVKDSYPALSNNQVKDLAIPYLHMILPGEVTIAVIGSGVDLSHPDLQPYLNDGVDFTQPGEPVIGREMKGSDSQGTHIAGIITQSNTELAAARVTGLVATIQAKYPELSANTIADVLRILGSE